MKKHALVVIFAILVGCREIPQQHGEAKLTVGGTRASVHPVVPESPGAPPLSACGLEAYPFPRPYEQILADAVQGPRKPTGSLHVKMLIDATGTVTHLRFLNLSSIDSVNKAALKAITRWHYKPTVFHGERVSVCSVTDVNIDF